MINNIINLFLCKFYSIKFNNFYKVENLIKNNYSKDIVKMLKNEHSQIIALILIHLNTSEALIFLKTMFDYDSDKFNEIFRRCLYTIENNKFNKKDLYLIEKELNKKLKNFYKCLNFSIKIQTEMIIDIKSMLSKVHYSDQQIKIINDIISKNINNDVPFVKTLEDINIQLNRKKDQ